MAHIPPALTTSEANYRTQVGTMLTNTIGDVKAEYKTGIKGIIQTIKDFFKEIGFKKQPIAQIDVKEKIVKDTAGLFKDFLKDVHFNADQDRKFRTPEYKAGAFLLFVQNEIYANANLKLHKAKDQTELYNSIKNEVNSILADHQKDLQHQISEQTEAPVQQEAPQDPQEPVLSQGIPVSTSVVPEPEPVVAPEEGNEIASEEVTVTSETVNVTLQENERSESMDEVIQTSEPVVSEPQEPVKPRTFGELVRMYRPSDEYKGISDQLDGVRLRMSGDLLSLQLTMNPDSPLSSSFDDIGEYPEDPLADKDLRDILIQDLDDLKEQEKALMSTISDYLGEGGEAGKFNELYPSTDTQL